MKNGTGINDTTTTIGVGPIELDVEMARIAGWSQAAIERAAKEIRKLSRRENALAHRNGPVASCRCVACDPQISMAGLPLEYQRQRQRWMDRGLWKG